MAINRRGACTALLTQALGLTSVAALAPGLAWAQDFPTRPVRLVVGAAPGGPSDFLARLMADTLSPPLGQPFVVENKPGASGTFAAEAVAKAAPDGYTLLLSGPAAVVNAPFVMARVGYDPAKDLVPVAVMGAGAFVLAVSATLPVRSVPELVAYARANPGAINYGSGGNGSSGHLAGEFFSQTVGVTMTHVPYKGDGLAANDLMGGQIQLMFTAPNVAMPHAKSGRLRILAVTSRERLPALPDVPTMIEAGVKDFEYLGWIIAFAPSGTPRPVLETLQAAWAKARVQPAVRGKLVDLGMQAPERLGKPEVMVAFLQDERERMARLVKAAGLKPE
ncbi:MAG: tripartite tricarboxylate transporter substrate binding protein [Burkholderiaceae bacterium]|jgi:tripartite-type tricarboxylate transporter receptor subunit TctC|nr:tripartite tricarboxylate transporter substrate binding protein [Burkholderiaceae bacterium]